jgi:hypothetical protein
MLAKKILLTLVLYCAVTLCFSQPGGGGDPGPGEPVPFQGLLFLLVAGAALGIKKLVRKKE